MINFFKKLFKKKLVKEGLFNVHHPDMQGKTEFAFECGGINYYRAVKDFMLPVGRFKFIDEKLGEVDIRMDLKTLKAYITELKKNIDGSKGTINLIKAAQIISAMETRCELAFEPETVKQLAAVVYFDETEDLRDFNREHAKSKIAFWEKRGNYSFFLTRPIAELLNLVNISEEYLVRYIKEVESIIKDLTLEQESQS